MAASFRADAVWKLPFNPSSDPYDKTVMALAQKTNVSLRPPGPKTSHNLDLSKWPGAAGQNAVVVLRYLVGEDGRVRAVKLIQPSGWVYQNDAAIANAMNWTFDPATLDGRPVAYWNYADLNFGGSSGGGCPYRAMDRGGAHCR